MKERTPGMRVEGALRRCAFRPVAVANGNSDGRLRPSGPIGSRALAMKPMLSRSAWMPSTPGMWLIMRKASLLDVELAAFKPRPVGHTGLDEPALEPRVAKLAVGVEDWIFAAVARVKLAQQFTDDGFLVLLHQIPQRHVDRHAAGLDLRD